MATSKQSLKALDPLRRTLLRSERLASALIIDTTMHLRVLLPLAVLLLQAIELKLVVCSFLVGHVSFVFSRGGSCLVL